VKKTHKKGTYWLDLADNGYWLIKNEAGYRECVGVGDEGKKAALEKIERLNKGSQMSKLKERELLKWFKDLYDAAPYVLGGSKDEQAYQQIKEMIQKESRVSMAEVENIVSAIRKHPNFIEATAGLSAWLEVKAGVRVA